MIQVILARHGETEWNKEEIFRGRADVELNENGRRQAELLGEYLAGEKVDIIYASPLKRAFVTAEAIARRQALKVNTVSNLLEFNYGEWQGLTLTEVKDRYPELYQDWLDTPEQVRMPGGETLAEVAARVLPFLEDAVRRCEKGRIIFVSHRVVNKVIICHLLGLDNSAFWNVRLDTAAITRFNFDRGRIILASHNDTSYLKPCGAAKLADF